MSLPPVAVLGTGLIGGSVSLGLRAAGFPTVGYDRDPRVLQEGLALHAFDTAAPSPVDAVREAELIVLAAPVNETESLCRAIREAVPPEAVITDVGSAKGRVVEACEPLLGNRFVGGHPMAGSERHGIRAADAELFQDAWWIVTPTATTSSAAYRRVSSLATTLGARPVALDPVDHDRLLARLSHLPQLVSSALVAAAVASEDKESLLGLAAGGFRDVTRIAASEPGLWVTILRANRHAVLEALQEYFETLEEVRDLLEKERYDGLEAYLGRSRAARRDLFGKPEMHDVPVALTMPVLDRPGVLAEVTTAAGGLGANIEDLRIVHSTEGGRGRLELIVAGEAPATRLAEALEQLGYRVERGRPE